MCVFCGYGGEWRGDFDDRNLHEVPDHRDQLSSDYKEANSSLYWKDLFHPTLAFILHLIANEITTFSTLTLRQPTATMFSSTVTCLSGALLLTSTMLQVLPVAAVPVASIADRDAVIPGYSISDVVWAVQTHPGGPTVNITGTVQDVIKYGEKVNPNFRRDFGLDQGGIQDHSLDKRMIEDHHDCRWPGGGWAQVDAIKHDIGYLRGVPGHPAMGMGHNNCGRVSCSDSSAIFWCNKDVCFGYLPSPNA